MFNRRQFLRFTGVGITALVSVPRIAFSSVASDRRFVFVIQRGAADGLNIVVPTGDPDYSRLRGTLAIADAVKLDSHFGLHPALAEIAKMYKQSEALFVHAIASAYRERSHFDGQNVLETGGAQPYQVKDGWLNRLVAALPNARGEAIAFATSVPMALRGSAEVASYAPSSLPEAPDELLERVGQLYARDEQFHSLWDAAMEARQIAGNASPRRNPAALGKLASSFLARDDGPRIAMIESGGWDTHAQQARRLANQLSGLDAMIASLREGLGPLWAKTTVLIATEFGRTAAPNGTGGTDHGTASAAMLIGGAVNGRHVIADWPGLSAPSLYEGRDLRATASLEALIAAVASQTFGIDPSRLFNRSTGAARFEGLIS